MTAPAPGGGSEVPREMRLDLPAVHSAARMARRLIRPFARSSGVAGRDQDKLLLVAEELLTNAVDHGGGGAAIDEKDLTTQARMSMQVIIGPKTWEVRVADQGGGDPVSVEKLLRKDELPDLEDERGRGFFLMSQLVDSIKVEKSEDGRGPLVSAACRHGQDV